VSSFELRPRTDAGQKLLELAEQHASEAAPHAAAHDQAGTFPTEAIDAMRASGFLTSAIPQDLGGLGVASVHDIMVGLNRLGRADSSLAIACNMHFAVSIVIGRIGRMAREAGEIEAAAGIEQFLAVLGSGAVVMANATEAGTDTRYPMTEARRVEEGIRIDGHKIFGTLSPVADLMVVTCREKRDDGSYAAGIAIVPRGTPGQKILDNWDALGMRGSGSNDVIYENCVIPPDMYFAEGNWGEIDANEITIGTAGNLGLLGSFLGIAEAARDHVIEMCQKRTKQPTGRPLSERRGIQHAIAEMDIALNTARAHLAWAGRHVDEVLIERPALSVSMDELHQLMALFQATKVVVQRSAIEVVDKAMQVSGGAGYLNSSPLARLYRDVRAGPFMQPLSANDAHEYIGRVAVGLPGDVEA